MVGRAKMTKPVTVVCMKWGDAYGPEYVNRLYAMTARHLSRPHRFMCFTDDTNGLRPEVETAPMPPITLDPKYSMAPWRKIGLFNAKLADLEGQALFLDLDLIVVGPLDEFFDYEPDRFCIIHNWTRPGQRVGNSSVYRFEIGADSYVLDRFYERPHMAWIERYRNSQTFLSNTVKDMVFWPKKWCVSFKRHCLAPIPFRWTHPARIPSGARIVVFHGRPNPDEALEGRWPGAWYRKIQPARWIADHWRE